MKLPSSPYSFEPQEIVTIGSFGNQEIKIRIDSKGTKGLIIFFHGLGSSAFGSGPTNHSWLYDYFLAEGYSCALYESSRSSLPENSSTLSFEEQAKIILKNKTFEDEINDAQSYFLYITEKFKRNNSKALSNVHLVGFSLGGILATVLGATHTPKSISLFGSSLGFNLEPKTPILGKAHLSLDSFIKKVTNSARVVAGNILMVRGDDDTTAQSKETIDLFQAFNNAQRRNLVMLKGVNHRFKTNDGKLDLELLPKLASMIEQTALQ
jgi:predicted esterase